MPKRLLRWCPAVAAWVRRAAGLERGRGVDGPPGLVTSRFQGHVVGWATTGHVGGAVGIAQLGLDGVGVAGGTMMPSQW